MTVLLLLAALAAPLVGECPTPAAADLPARFEAAQCLAAAGRWGAAAQHYQAIVAASPQHPLAEASLLRLAVGHRAIARFADAARYAEQFAARYTMHPEAPALLVDAAQVRLALGERTAALANLDHVEMLWQRRDPERAAELFWGRRRLLTTEAERLVHAETFLKRHGQTAGLDRRVVAEVTIAALEWARACPVRPRDDLCVEPAPPGKHRARRCADGPTMRPVARDPARAAAAQQRLAAALRLSTMDPKLPADQVQRRREYEDALATAALLVADRRLEELLTIHAPTGLMFGVDEALRARDPRAYAKQVRRRAASLRRFSEYFGVTQKLAQELGRQYEAIAGARRSPRAMIAARARGGVVMQHLAADLLAVAIPADIRGPDATKFFCSELRRHADGYQALAATAFARCVELASQLGEWSELSRGCEDAAHALDPRAHPRLAEIFAPEPRTITALEEIELQQDPTPFMPADASGS